MLPVNVVDLSGRRGAIVPMLPKIYVLLNADTEKDAQQNIILWTQDMRSALLDIRRKWLFALAGEDGSSSELKGVLFYRLGEDGQTLYLDELKAADGAVFTLLINKFQQDTTVKARTAFYAGVHIRRDEASEMLASVGLQDDSVFTDGY